MLVQRVSKRVSLRCPQLHDLALTIQGHIADRRPMLVLSHTVVDPEPLWGLHLFDMEVHHVGGGIQWVIKGFVVPVADQYPVILLPVVPTLGETHHCAF